MYRRSVSSDPARVVRNSPHAGPKSLKIAKEADVTVVLYTQKNVKKTLAFEKGKLTDKAADEVAAAVKEHAAATDK